MAALPVLSGRKAVRAFEKLGWQVARQRGSHIIMGKRKRECDAVHPRPQGSCQRHSSQSDSRRRNHRGRVCPSGLMAPTDSALTHPSISRNSAKCPGKLFCSLPPTRPVVCWLHRSATFQCCDLSFARHIATLKCRATWAFPRPLPLCQCSDARTTTFWRIAGLQPCIASVRAPPCTFYVAV
jgi:predicted RNA binding protein YcfA (HicA-like mRNA interferase family)